MTDADVMLVKNKDGLLPCPFHSPWGELQVRLDGVYWVQCMECNAEGPPSPKEYLAVGMWNTRPASD